MLSLFSGLLLLLLLSLAFYLVFQIVLVGLLFLALSLDLVGNQLGVYS